MNDPGNTADAIRHARRQRLMWTGVAAGIAAFVGVVIGWATSRHGHHRAPVHPSAGVEAASLTLIVAGVVVVLGVIVFAYRTGKVRSSRTSALWTLDRRAKRSVIRQARGREPVDPDRRTLVFEAAHRLADQHWMIVVFGGTALIGVGQIVGRQQSLGQWFWVAYLVVIVLAAAGTARSIGQARRFLREHGRAPT